MASFAIILLPFSLMAFVDSARILAVLPFQIKSHNAVFQRYVEGLSARGHELIVASPFPSRRHLKNYTFINTKTVIPDTSDSIAINSQTVSRSIRQHLSFMRDFESVHCRRILAHPDLRRLYESDEKLFDAVIFESYYVHCYLPLGITNKVPTVWLLAPTRMFAADLAIGNDQHPAYLPSLLRKYEFSPSSNTTFFNRMVNLKNYLLSYWYHHFLFAPLTRNICEEYFIQQKIGSCDVNEHFKDVSLLLTYSHNALHPRSTVPNHVQIGGLHIEPAKPLPADLLDFLDETTEDVIFVSFGSLVKISMAENKLIDALLHVFSTCNCRILWRCDFDESNSTRLPKNVLAKKWFPQRDVLAHPKIKAIISHGGLYSTYEAIYTATPVIGVPLFFDQFDNILRLVELNVGILVSYDQISINLKSAVAEILKNPSYSENMMRLSKVVQDESMSPLDKAVYWTEYVIRHNGAVHLRSSAADLPLYQFLLLDVLCIIALPIIIIIFVLQKIFQFVIRSIFCKPRPEENRIKKLQ